MMDDKKKKRLNDALYKRAIGYVAHEKNEEYAFVDGELKLVKQKLAEKEVPPELSAIKLLLGDEPEPQMTEEELLKERHRLLTLLKESTKDTIE